MTQQIQELVTKMNIAKAEHNIEAVKICVNKMRELRGLSKVDFTWDEESQILFLESGLATIAAIEF